MIFFCKLIKQIKYENRIITPPIIIIKIIYMNNNDDDLTK